MQSDLREQAEKLASRPYAYKLMRDETTDGDTAYVAEVLELPGCYGSGPTEQEAIRDVKLAMVDFIHSLLEDNMPVPNPMPVSQSSGSRSKPLSREVMAFPNATAQETATPKYLQTFPA